MVPLLLQSPRQQPFDAADAAWLARSLWLPSRAWQRRCHRRAAGPGALDALGHQGPDGMALPAFAVRRLAHHRHPVCARSSRTPGCGKRVLWSRSAAPRLGAMKETVATFSILRAGLVGLLLTGAAGAVHAGGRTLSCPDPATLKRVATCPSEAELRYTFTGFCSSNERLYGRDTELCTSFERYRQAKDVALVESADGDQMQSRSFPTTGVITAHSLGHHLDRDRLLRHDGVDPVEVA